MRIMDDETQLKVRKFLKRLGISSQQELNQFIENNPDVQDLSIKVSFEINDKNVFEFEDNISKGKNVYHQKFGNGKIIKLDGNKALIDFENFSSKKIYLKFLKVID